MIFAVAIGGIFLFESNELRAYIFAYSFVGCGAVRET